MKSFSEKMEKIMMAITFAESGEHQTAKEFMKETDAETAGDIEEADEGISGIVAEEA